MPKYRVPAKIYYSIVIEAENEEQALERAWDIEVGPENWEHEEVLLGELDEIYEEDEDE